MADLRMKLKRWYGFVAEQPCLRCSAQPVELAHVKVVLSPKTGQLLPRRVGIAKWAVLPLCPDCHRHAPDSIHAVGEAEFLRCMGMDRLTAAQHILGLLLQHLVED